jgi:hypothetical protein
MDAGVFPKQLTWFGWLIVLPSLYFAAHIVWEQTVWTWDSGPQMVGFSLMHSGIGGLLYLALYSGIIWVVAVAIFAWRSKTLGGSMMATLILAYALSWGMLAIPYGFWQRAFIDKLVHRPDVGDFVSEAAAWGDIQTVQAFLSNGASVNVLTRRGGATPLHAAAVGGQPAVVEYLISRGADVNAVNLYGNSPLANAIDARHNATATAEVLTRRGGKEIRGTKEQRDQVIAEEVRRNIEEMDKKESK